MAFAGLRGTGDWGTDERPKNFRNTILWRQPNGAAPLTALLAKMKTETTDDPEFSWWEEENTITRVQTSAAILGTTDTAFTLITNGLALVAGDVLLVETATEVNSYTNELITVSSVASDTSVVFKRAQVNTTATAIPASSFLTKIGNAYGEGTTSPNTTSRNPTKISNLCQIFKTAYELTNTAKATNARTGDPLKNDKVRRMFDHSAALEQAFLWGKKYETVGSNNKPLRYTGGLRQFITTNVSIFAVTPTEDSFFDAIYPVFNFSADSASSNERIVLCGNGFLNGLNKLARGPIATSRMRHDDTVKFYGMELMKWSLPQGTLLIKSHPLMNVHPKYTNSAFVINPSALVYRPLQGRDTKPQDNLQLPDSDTQKGQWLTEAGLEVQHEKTMAYIGNFVV
jgi:hypothetical protein